MDEGSGVPSVDFSRRQFFFGLAAGSLLFGSPFRIGQAWAREIITRLNRQVPFLDHSDAVAEGLYRGIGHVEVLAPMPDRFLVAAQTATFQFRYVTGETPILPGGFIWFAMRHVFQATNPQATDRTKAGYVTFEAPPGVGVELVVWPDRVDDKDLFLRAFPWQHPIEIRITSGRLNPGDSILLTYGDPSGGGPGVKLQATQEPGFAFRVYVAPSSDDPFMPLAQDLVFPIVGGPVERLSLIASPAAGPGEPIRILLRAEDNYGNQAVTYTGSILLRADDGRDLAQFSVSPEHQGVFTSEIAPFRTDRVMRFEATDGALTARSNPVKADKDPFGRHNYFGDIHGHSLLSDGRGTPEEFYLYARDVAALDFCALTDHDFMLTDEMWASHQSATERANAPGRFVTIHGYEWSGMSDVGGDHNVFFRGSDTMLVRCRSYYDYRNQQAYHGREAQANHIEDLYAALLARYPEGEVMTIPHYGGRPANPTWHNPRVERMIEIFSDHQRSHEWAYDFLRKGYRIGIMGSTDNHTGRPGYGFLQNPFFATRPFEIGTALIGVSAGELSREAIFDAVFQRHAYATSGERILLEIQFGGAGMGEEISAPATPVLRAEVEGTADIAAVEIWKDVALVHTMPASSESVVLEWTDPEPPVVGETAAYWVRVAQVNNEEAISSPVWYTRT